MYLNQGMTLDDASKKAYKRVGEVLEAYFGAEKFQMIPDKIDDMRRDFRGKKAEVETEYQSGGIDAQERAKELKQEWEVIRKGYNTDKKKSLKFSGFGILK